MSRNPIKHLPEIVMFAMLIGFTTAESVAQVDVPEGCREGNGTYTGGFSGNVRYYAFGNPSRKVLFFEDDAMRSWKPGISGSEFTFSDFTGNGVITISRTADNSGNVFTINGQYHDCGVTGTWRIDYGDDRASVSGEFEMEGTAPAPTVDVSDLCGTLNGGALAPLLLSMAFVSIRRRGRNHPRR